MQERLFLVPERVRPFAEALAERLRACEVEVVCAPLVEGAFVGLMVASSLGVPFSYSQPLRTGSDAALFPISYPIPAVLRSELRSKRVAVVNDVINAGSAVRGTLETLGECGARPVAIATLAVYGDSASQLATDHGIALETLASFSSQIWLPDECPLCAEGVRLEMPGQVERA